MRHLLDTWLSVFYTVWVFNLASSSTNMLPTAASRTGLSSLSRHSRSLSGSSTERGPDPNVREEPSRQRRDVAVADPQYIDCPGAMTRVGMFCNGPRTYRLLCNNPQREARVGLQLIPRALHNRADDLISRDLGHDQDQDPERDSPRQRVAPLPGDEDLDELGIMMRDIVRRIDPPPRTVTPRPALPLSPPRVARQAQEPFEVDFVFACPADYLCSEYRMVVSPSARPAGSTGVRCDSPARLTGTGGDGGGTGGSSRGPGRLRRTRGYGNLAGLQTQTGREAADDQPPTGMSAGTSNQGAASLGVATYEHKIRVETDIERASISAILIDDSTHDQVQPASIFRASVERDLGEPLVVCHSSVDPRRLDGDFCLPTDKQPHLRKGDVVTFVFDLAITATVADHLASLAYSFVGVPLKH